VVGGRAAYRLEHGDTVGVQVAAGRDAHAALDHRAQVGDDIAEHVVGDDHIEPSRPIEEVDAARVDVHVVDLHVRVLARDLVDDPLIQVSGEGQNVRLVHERDLASPARSHRQLERVPNDPFDPVARVDALLHRDLERRSSSMEAPRSRVEALGVLANHHHVDVLFGVARDQCLNARIAPDRPKVDVLVELEPDPKQQIALEDPGPHARIADRA
jgi:hypothetical protein